MDHAVDLCSNRVVLEKYDIGLLPVSHYHTILFLNRVLIAKAVDFRL